MLARFQQRLISILFLDKGGLLHAKARQNQSLYTAVGSFSYPMRALGGRGLCPGLQPDGAGIFLPPGSGRPDGSRNRHAVCAAKSPLCQHAHHAECGVRRTAGAEQRGKKCYGNPSLPPGKNGTDQPVFLSNRKLRPFPFPPCRGGAEPGRKRPGNSLRAGGIRGNSFRGIAKDPGQDRHGRNFSRPVQKPAAQCGSAS